MSEKIVKFSPFQKATSADLNEMGTFVRESLDHLVFDGLDSGRRYAGLNTVISGTTKVRVGPGRLYKNGAVFFNYDEGGVEINFLDVLPLAGRRICALVISDASNSQGTQTENREFLTDVETRVIEARPTATESWRNAAISRVVGDAAPTTPVAPIPEGQRLTFALVTLSTTQVERVDMYELTRLRSVNDAYEAAKGVSDTVDLLSPKLTSIETDISRLASGLLTRLDSEFGYRMASDLARLKEKYNVPDTAVDYGNDVFLDEDESDKTSPGYSAKIMDGLRFPNAAEQKFVLALQNPLDSNVYRDPSGLILPTWKDTRVRVVANPAGELALNSVAYDSSTILQVNFFPFRERYGEEFVVSSSSSWWNTVRYIDVAKGQFTKDGVNYQQYPSNIFNADGTRQIRVRSIWADFGTAPYWTRTASPENLVGFKHARTFVNAQDRWVTALGLHFTRKDTSGGITIMLVECDDSGKPDEKKVMTKTVIQPSDIGVLYQFGRFPVPPVLIESGKMYAVMVVTAGNHWLGFADITQSHTGTQYFKNGVGIWQADPSKNMLFDIWFAEFDKARTEVALAPIELAGGIASLDFLMESAVLPSSKIHFEVVIGGVRTALTQDMVAKPFASLPSLVQLFMIMQGGSLSQPGINLARSQVIASRPGLSLKHASSARTLPSGITTTKFRTTTRIENYVAAKHAVVPKIKVGATEYTAGVITDRVISDRVVERTAVFTLGAATGTFQRITTATNSDINDPCVISEVSDIALP